MSNFTREYFIAKFTAIPEDQWCTGCLTDESGRHDAFGHCTGSVFDDKSERHGLSLVLRGVSAINDQIGDGRRFTQTTPKQRILAALQTP